MWSKKQKKKKKKPFVSQISAFRQNLFSFLRQKCHHAINKKKIQEFLSQSLMK